MNDHPTVHELVSKFVATNHLNVPERKLLPGGSLPASLIVAEVCRRVAANPSVEGLLDAEFNGGLIELLEGGRCKVHWKAEVGYLRYELVAVQEFASLPEAARDYAMKTFGHNSDGIPIDWSH